MKTKPKILLTIQLTVAGLLTLAHADQDNSKDKPKASSPEAAASLEQVATGFRMAEGPAWDGESFIFSDVPPSKILKLGTDGKVSTIRSDTRWGAGLAFDSKRRLLICEVMGRRVTRVENDGTETILAESYEGKKLNGPNDLAVDAKDGIYFTDPLFMNRDKREQDKEAVYYINPEGKVLRVADDLERPNGTALAGDGKTLFVADTAKSKLRAYPVKEDGTLAEGRDFGSVPGPDGVRVDLDGKVYAAGRTGIAVWDASGKRLGTLKVPVTPNSLAFGGADRRTMYITTAPSVYKIRLEQALKMLNSDEPATAKEPPAAAPANPEEFAQRIQGKIKKLQEGVQKWQNEGKDPSPIAQLMQQFGPLMQDGKVEEAEKILDKALAELAIKDQDTPPAKSDVPSPTPAPGKLEERIQQKAERVQAGIQKWTEEDKDPSAVAAIIQEAGSLFQGGKAKEGEAKLDEALALLEGKPEGKPQPAAIEAGFIKIFNGADLTGWDGDPRFWSVENGAITGRTSDSNRPQNNTFLIWRAGTVDDFELRLSYRIVNGNSGIQYRSKDRGHWVVSGYQADIESGKSYTGLLVEEGGRFILAQRGQMTVVDSNGRVRVLSSLGSKEEIQAVVKGEGWNDYVIIARGNHLTHIINGRVAADVTDEQVDRRALSGILAFQLHVGPPMTVQFKDIRLKRLATASPNEAPARRSDPSAIEAPNASKTKSEGAQTKTEEKPPVRLQQKMQQLQESIQQWQQDGRDLSPIGELMQEFGPLRQEGKFKEAEAVLDRALARIKDLGAAPVRKREATPAENLTLLPGFKVELIRNAQPGEGSWICMTIDDKDRLIISPQDRSGLLRMTLAPDGQVAKVERISQSLGNAMGLLYAFDSLYLNGGGPKGLGVYRLRDTNGDDQYDDVQFLKKWEGDSGEHGPHAIVLGPDQKLYVMNGNHTKVPEGIEPSSPHRNYQEDLLLPRRWDPSGHATGILAPGGYLLRTDAEGHHWEMLLGGFRNTYDFAFNADGEMFGFDADMEYDVGLPWYRPTRVHHLVSGGEYGWRSGSGKWPVYYPDSLPPVLDVGLGSPTGARFGTGSQFPQKYQKALFAMDWTAGRILAVHLRPKDSSYTGSFETFIQGKPLPVTDLEFGPGGAMYFIIGGRGNQSGLYRVSYAGPSVNELAQTDEEVQAEKAAAEVRALRHKLESYHDEKDPAAIEFAWPHLDSEDRWIRHAARIAIEGQDLALWKDRALAERRIHAGLAALIALARNGGPKLQEDLLESLNKVASNHPLSEAQTLEYLRVLGLAFIRMGRPTEEKARALVERLDRMYPASSESLNRELCQLLVYLQSPHVAKKTLALVEKASTQEDRLRYLFHLRTLNSGWTMEDRKTYLQWLNGDWSSAPKQARTYFDSVGRKYADGPTFSRWLAYTKSDAALTMTDQERDELAPMLANRAAALPPVRPARSFVKEWTPKDLEPLLDRVSNGRSFENGKAAFAVAQCLACHRFNGEGGATGPDLTTAASRFDRRTLLESILEPSKVISDQYHNVIIVKKDGTEVTGRIVEENARQIGMLTNPFTEDSAKVLKTDVQTRVVSKVSPMPPGLLNVLTQEEILDLLAFVESGGKSDASTFVNSSK